MADVVRHLTSETEWRYRLAPGTIVLPAVALCSARRSTTAAMRSIPARALPRRLAAAVHVDSFGGGVRRCIGAAFATLEMKVVLREVLGGSSSRRPPPAARTRSCAGWTLLPKRGGEVVVRRRCPISLARPPWRPLQQASFCAGASRARQTAGGGVALRGGRTTESLVGFRDAGMDSKSSSTIPARNSPSCSPASGAQHSPSPSRPPGRNTSSSGSDEVPAIFVEHEP